MASSCRPQRQDGGWTMRTANKGAYDAQAQTTPEMNQKSNRHVLTQHEAIDGACQVLVEFRLNFVNLYY